MEVEDVAWEDIQSTMEDNVGRDMHEEHGRSCEGCDIPCTQKGNACY